MARPIWSGTISFGLVSVPVSLYTATRDHTVSFHQFERGTSDRIRYRRVNERTGKEVEYDDIVKGREVDGDLVLVEPDELDEIAPGRSQSLDVESFVDLTEIDPIYFQKTYWLAPTKKADPKAYALLVKAMAETNRVGIGTFVMRGKEYVAAIRADDGVMALDTLYFADEVQDPGEVVDDLPEVRSGKQLDMAVSLVESMSSEWKPEEFRDTFTEKVEQLLEDKRKGREVVKAPEPPEATNVVDLADALQRSVEQARGRGKGTRKQGPDLSELSKSELDELARELDVKGRSKMKRAELEKAVADAGAKSRKAAS